VDKSNTILGMLGQINVNGRAKKSWMNTPVFLGNRRKSPTMVKAIVH